MYELSTSEHEINYPKGKSRIVYCGSSKNIRERLLTYLNGYGHTDEIRRFVNEHFLNVRYLRTVKYRELEARLIAEFETRMGSLPLLNTVRPKAKP